MTSLQLISYRSQKFADRRGHEAEAFADSAVVSNQMYQSARGGMTALRSVNRELPTAQERRFRNLLKDHLQEHRENGGLLSLQDASCSHVRERLHVIAGSPFAFRCHAPTSYRE